MFMKKYFFIFFPVILLACSNNNAPRATGYELPPTDYLAGRIITVANPFEKSDTVLAINAKFSPPNVMNGRDYILTLDKQILSFMDGEKMRDSIILPITGNNTICEHFVIYNREVHDTLQGDYIYSLGEKVYNMEVKIEKKDVEIVANPSSRGEKPYTYYKLTASNDTVYMFEMTRNTHFMTYDAFDKY